MKKMIFLAAVCLSYFSSSAQLNINTLAGQWISAEGGGIEIVDSSQIYLVYGKEKKLISSFRQIFQNHHAGLTSQ